MDEVSKKPKDQVLVSEATKLHDANSKCARSYKAYCVARASLAEAKKDMAMQLQALKDKADELKGLEIFFAEAKE